jgi:hypothetical protein
MKSDPYSVRMYGVTFQMIDTEVCIPPEDDPEIGSKRVVGKHKNTINTRQLCSSRVEAGSNTSTVTLRVVGGNKKGSRESETVKYGCESHGIRTLE